MTVPVHSCCASWVTIFSAQAVRNAETSTLIAQALELSIPLEKYPKAAIDVHIFVLESSGGVVGTATTCASLALADAGVELFDLVAACSAVCAPRKSVLHSCCMSLLDSCHRWCLKKMVCFWTRD